MVLLKRPSTIAQIAYSSSIMKLVFSYLLLIGSASAFSPSSLSRSAARPCTLPAIAVPIETASFQEEGTLVVESKTQRPKLPLEDQWIANLDYEGFGKEVKSLGKELLQEGGMTDAEHLQKIITWRNIAAVVGVSTMWLPPNPLSIVALSTWTYASWTMIAHHTCHGGYNRIQSEVAETTGSKQFKSTNFALGSVARRVKDWCDWMKPEAWNVEHNRLHHYRLNELSDPDLVQRNLAFLRSSKLPRWVRYVFVAATTPVWKWYYYAPNTYKELKTQALVNQNEALPDNFDPESPITLRTLLFPSGEQERAVRKVVNPLEFFKSVMVPFLMTRFVLLPAPLLAVPGMGPTLYRHAVINLLAAELLTNIHSFLTIVTNHSGEDMYTFDDAVRPKSSAFYVRQIVGSANYRTGTDPVDFAHGWLNYQVEHHVWPDLSMRQYQTAAPRLKALCQKYNVPYVQESVWKRLRKTVDVMVGKTSMRRFPTEYEPQGDKATAKSLLWKSSNGAIDDGSKDEL